MEDSRSNEEAVQRRIRELRRERSSALGKIDRAFGTMTLLESKIRRERNRYRLAGEQIVELGGRIRK